MDIEQIAKETQTRHLKRANILKSSNFEFVLDSKKAYSYGWWLFCTEVNGKVIFNNTTYSMSTCKHQIKAMQILDYKYDLKLSRTTSSLANLKDALYSEVQGTKAEIRSLIRAIRKPRTHKAKNAERRQEIVKLLKHIAEVRAVKSEVENV
jgi:hypothetical protein